jgi:hypothetical protein
MGSSAGARKPKHGQVHPTASSPNLCAPEINKKRSLSQPKVPSPARFEPFARPAQSALNNPHKTTSCLNGIVEPGTRKPKHSQVHPTASSASLCAPEINKNDPCFSPKYPSAARFEPLARPAQSNLIHPPCSIRPEQSAQEQHPASMGSSTGHPKTKTRPGSPHSK